MWWADDGGWAPAVVRQLSCRRCGAAPNLLLCRRDLDNATVERTVQLLVHSAAELIPQSSLGVPFLGAESLINTAGVPLHPAAADA